MTPATIEPDRDYPAREAAAFFGVHPGTLRRWRSKGYLDAAGHRPAAVFRGAELLRRRRVLGLMAEPGPGVIVQPKSGNKKLGRVATTLAARQSCPADCRFRANGCYAEHDNNRVHWDRITAGAPAASPLDLARAEAAGIDRLPADRDLRLHVAGDSVTEEGTRIVAAACGRYVLRGAVPVGTPRTFRRDRLAAAGWPMRRPAVWAYTHGWRVVPREAWGVVSVLASCESAADVRDAVARGYAVALAVPAFDRDRAYPAAGATVVPCPQQTRGRTCTACRLCFDDARLRRRGLAVGFAVHGAGSSRATAALGRVALPMAGAA